MRRQFRQEQGFPLPWPGRLILFCCVTYVGLTRGWGKSCGFCLAGVWLFTKKGVFGVGKVKTWLAKMDLDGKI